MPLRLGRGRLEWLRGALCRQDVSFGHHATCAHIPDISRRGETHSAQGAPLFRQFTAITYRDNLPWYVRVRACVRAFERPCVRAFARSCVHVCVHVGVRVRMPPSTPPGVRRPPPPPPPPPPPRRLWPRPSPSRVLAGRRQHQSRLPSGRQGVQVRIRLPVLLHGNAVTLHLEMTPTVHVFSTNCILF